MWTIARVNLWFVGRDDVCVHLQIKRVYCKYIYITALHYDKHRLRYIDKSVLYKSKFDMLKKKLSFPTKQRADL